jgi:uncharacterized membrane protein
MWSSRSPRETARIEAFSDGVFAIAMTLLVLELKVPSDAFTDSQLATDLAREWPSYLAFGTSCFTMLTMWMNHHRIFALLGKSDDRLMFYNGLLLSGVSLVPFPTSLIATYFVRGGQRTAAIVYSGTFLVIAVMFNLLWRSAAVDDRLFHPNVDRAAVRWLSRAFRLGPPWYLVAAMVASVSVTASLLLNLGLAVFVAAPVGWLPFRRSHS